METIKPGNIIYFYSDYRNVPVLYRVFEINKNPGKEGVLLISFPPSPRSMPWWAQPKDIMLATPEMIAEAIAQKMTE